MTQPTKFRYSTGVLEPKDAPKFDWEYPIPVIKFWNSFSYVSAKNFLLSFDKNEVSALNLDTKHCDLSHKEKANLLLDTVKGKITSLDASSKSGNAPYKPLWETDFPTWQNLMQAAICMYGELGQLDEEIEAEEQIILRRGDKGIAAQAHGLAELLAKRGKQDDCEKAEDLEKKGLPWFDEHLGPDSPQALSVRRVLLAAVWRQGKYDEADKLKAELTGLIDGLGKSKYSAYQDEERQLLEGLVKGLESKKKGN